jgi:hypothetical protein
MMVQVAIAGYGKKMEWSEREGSESSEIDTVTVLGR